MRAVLCFIFLFYGLSLISAVTQNLNEGSLSNTQQDHVERLFQDDIGDDHQIQMYSESKMLHLILRKNGRNQFKDFLRLSLLQISMVLPYFEIMPQTEAVLKKNHLLIFNHVYLSNFTPKSQYLSTPAEKPPRG